MIRVSIDMVPRGIESEARHMATIEIQNDVLETVQTRGRRGSYLARFSRISQRGEHLDNYDRIVRITNVRRTQSGAVYRILYLALRDFLGEA